MAEGQRKRIAIIGSADPARNDVKAKDSYCPHHSDAKHDCHRLRNANVALDACRQLGAALAEANLDIVVYAGETPAGKAGFNEPEVVTGYINARVPVPGSVRVLYSPALGEPHFRDQAARPDAFSFHPDVSEDWEPSFFRSMAEVDAALIVGGGWSGYMAGLVCLGRRIPLLPIATFGAGGYRVYNAMIKSRTPIPRPAIELLGRPQWAAASAPELVGTLVTQQDRLDLESAEAKRARDTAEHSRSTWLALGLFILLALLLPSALVVEDPGSWLELALLFATPVLSGSVGGTIRTLLPGERHIQVDTRASAGLGAIAGGISGLLYLVSQITSTTTTDLGDLTALQYQTYVLFSVVIGFLAGLALDATYQRFAKSGAEGPSTG